MANELRNFFSGAAKGFGSGIEIGQRQAEMKQEAELAKRQQVVDSLKGFAELKKLPPALAESLFPGLLKGVDIDPSGDLGKALFSGYKKSDEGERDAYIDVIVQLGVKASSSGFNMSTASLADFTKAVTESYEERRDAESRAGLARSFAKNSRGADASLEQAMGLGMPLQPEQMPSDTSPGWGVDPEAGAATEQLMSQASEIGNAITDAYRNGDFSLAGTLVTQLAGITKEAEGLAQRVHEETPGGGRVEINPLTGEQKQVIAQPSPSSTVNVNLQERASQKIAGERGANILYDLSDASVDAYRVKSNVAAATAALKGSETGALGNWRLAGEKFAELLGYDLSGFFGISGPKGDVIESVGGQFAADFADEHFKGNMSANELKLALRITPGLLTSREGFSELMGMTDRAADNAIALGDIANQWIEAGLTSASDVMQDGEFAGKSLIRARAEFLKENPVVSPKDFSRISKISSEGIKKAVSGEATIGIQFGDMSDEELQIMIDSGQLTERERKEIKGEQAKRKGAK